MWLHLDFPGLPLEVFPPIAKRQTATIVVTGSTHQAAIEAVNAAALAMGIQAGMPLAAAWCCAQQPLLVVQRDQRAEQAALEGLALWAGQYSSMVSIVPPRGIVLEVGRSFNLFDGMQALHQTVRQDLKNLFYSARFGMAPTPMGAELLARANIEQPVMDRRELMNSLSGLSVDFLEDGSGITGMLAQIGIRKIGECIALPRKEVSQRLGQNLWHTLDRVLGFAPDPRPCFAPPARFRRTLALPAPVDQAAALRFVMRRLLAELTAFLRIQQQGVERMVVELGGNGGELQSLAVGFADATRDPQRLAGMVESHLENCSLHHRVEHVGLTVQAMQPLRDHHGALFVNPLAEPDNIALLLDQLNARLGERRVSGLCLQAEHRPEYSWRYCRPGCVSTALFQPQPRPLWLLEKPFPIRGGESCLMWGRRKLHIEQGPERIESGWWDGHGIARDYYVARAAGGAMLWVFCERRGHPRWYAHGFFA